MRLLVFLLLLALSAAAQPQHGVRPARMIIQGATVVEGTGTPAQGPLDITIENGVITQIARG
ncbi:MAG: amidohydrolase, partial [Acidobacteriota bacterium]